MDMDKLTLKADGPYNKVTAYRTVDGGLYLEEEGTDNLVSLSPVQLSALVVWVLSLMGAKEVEHVQTT